MKYCLVVLLLAFSSSVFCQNSVLLISGEEFEGAKFDSLNSEYLYFTNKKNKADKVRLDDVYSYTKQGIPTVLYMQNPDKGNDLTVEEMSEFVKGERDAIKHFNPRLATGGSIVVGAASGALGFWGVPGPIIYSLACGSREPKQSVSEIEQQSTIYKAGYNTAAKSKKLRRTLIGGFASFIGTAIVIAFL